MARPHGTTGSLRPTFVPARPVGLAVRLPYAYALAVRLPTALREPSRASVTISEASAPDKLPACHGPRGCEPLSENVTKVRVVFHWWLPTGRNPGSSPPTYATQTLPTSNDTVQERGTVSFCPFAGNRNPHRYCSFAELTVETAVKSLRHSCRSELTRQGISLP